MNNFYYHIDENDSLIFKPNRYGFELYTKGEASKEIHLANYENYTWKFEDDIQRSTFFTMMKMDQKSFQRAFKAYWKSKEEIDNFIIIQCAKRKTKIEITKILRKLRNKFNSWFYGLYEGNNRNK
jgi:hypothetical protein